jgi:hypothetical protein
VINDTGQVPSRDALEHSITRHGITTVKEENLTTAAVLDYLDKLFNHFPDNDKFLLQELEKHAIDENMFAAASQGLNDLEEGRYERAVDRLSRALATGSRSVKLAGPEWYTEPPLLKKELISGVLRRGGIGIFNGHSKSYKSWTLLNCGMAVATGRSWLGFKALAPARVLYVNMELDSEEFKVRVDKVARGMGLSRAALKEEMDFLHLAGFECGLEKMVATLRRLRNPERPWELVIVDPVYKLLTAGRDLETENIENNNTAIGAALCTLRELTRELDVAIFLVHHFKKGSAANTANIDSGAGGGMFGREPDTIMSSHPVRDEENKVVEGAAIIEATVRYFPPIADFGIRLDPEYLVWNRDITINPENVAGKTGRPQKHHIGQALSILQGNRSFTNVQWKDHAKAEYDMNKERWGLFRDEALEKEWVTASGLTSARNTTYTLTPAGEEAILQANVTAAQNGHLSAKAREIRARMNGNGN